jgi:putative ABC transport system permease protein
MAPLREYADLGLFPQRLAASVAGSLGIVALLLAAIGLYGVTAYMVASRSREIGIRMALGSSAGATVALMLRSALEIAAIGGAIGLALAAGASLAIGDLLFGISPLDPLAYISTLVVLGGVTLAATYVPARRAAAVDPLRALRAE